MLKKCVERYCELENRKDSAAKTKSQVPCLDDHNFNKEELETVGELSKTMFTNCLENACTSQELVEKRFLQSVKQTCSSSIYHKMHKVLWTEA